MSPSPSARTCRPAVSLVDLRGRHGRPIRVGTTCDEDPSVGEYRGARTGPRHAHVGTVLELAGHGVVEHRARRRVTEVARVPQVIGPAPPCEDVLARRRGRPDATPDPPSSAPPWSTCPSSGPGCRRPTSGVAVLDEDGAIVERGHRRRARVRREADRSTSGWMCAFASSVGSGSLSPTSRASRTSGRAPTRVRRWRRHIAGRRPHLPVEPPRPHARHGHPALREGRRAGAASVRCPARRWARDDLHGRREPCIAPCPAAGASAARCSGTRPPRHAQWNRRSGVRSSRRR